MNSNGSNGQAAPVAVSPKRLAANRANALKSTGPRSAEGKKRSSLNALRHGLTAQTAVLAGESPHELADMAGEVRKELRPRGPVQEMLAGRVLSLMWKLRRVGRAEEELYRRAADQPLERWGSRKGMHQAYPKVWPDPGPAPEAGTAAAALADQFDGRGRAAGVDGPLVRLEAYADKLDRSIQRALRELRLLQKEQREREEEPWEEDGGSDDAARGNVVQENEATAEAEGPEEEQGQGEGHAGPEVERRGEENEATARVPTAPDGAGGAGSREDQGEAGRENEPSAGLEERLEVGESADPRSRKRLNWEVPGGGRGGGGTDAPRG